MTKMTKKNYFKTLVNFANTGVLTIPADELGAFAEKEIALLDKKAAKAKETAAKKKAEMDELTGLIADVLYENGGWMTIVDVTNDLVASGYDVTPAKVQYRLNTLVKDAKAEKAEATFKEEGKKARKAMTYKWGDTIFFNTHKLENASTAEGDEVEAEPEDELAE